MMAPAATPPQPKPRPPQPPRQRTLSTCESTAFLSASVLDIGAAVAADAISPPTTSIGATSLRIVRTISPSPFAAASSYWIPWRNGGAVDGKIVLACGGRQEAAGSDAIVTPECEIRLPAANAA